MPNIREYTQRSQATTGIPGTSSSPQDFGAGVGQAVSQFAAATGQAYQTVLEVESRQDVSNVHASLAKARSDWTVALSERAAAAPLGDPTFASTYAKDLGDYLVKAKEGVKTKAGQRAFDEQAATLQASLVERAGLFQSQSAGAKAKADYLTTLDSSRNTLLSDPTQFSVVMQQSLSAIEDPDGQFARLSGEDRAALTAQTRKTLSQSYYQGLIQNGAPELALRKLQAGDDDQYLDADTKAALVREAKVGINGEQAEEERLRREAERAKKQAQEATQQQFVAALTENKLTVADVLKSNLDAVGDGSKEHFINVMRARANEVEKPVKTDPSVMYGLYADIRTGKVNTTDAIDAQYLRGKLSWEDKERLSKALFDLRTPDGDRLQSKRGDFIEGVRKQIDKSNPLMGALDPSGAQAVYEFSFYVDQKIEEYRKAGKNPYDLFDPTKTDYLGSPETISSFKKPISESMETIRGNLRGSAPMQLPPEQQRREGETVAQWRARTGQ